MIMSFAGLRVLALEARRATEIAQLIRNHSGDMLRASRPPHAPPSNALNPSTTTTRQFTGELIASQVAAAYILPDEPWARRISGTFANALTRKHPPVREC